MYKDNWNPPLENFKAVSWSFNGFDEEHDIE